MKLFPIAVLTAGLAFTPALVAQSNDLPSAPSAVKQQSQPKPPPPAPAPSTPAAAPAPQQPALESLPDSKPAAPPAAAQPPAEAQPQVSSGPSQHAATARNDPAPGGAGDIPDDQPTAVFRSRVDEVNVIFTVTDKHGKFVKDLNQQDFKVLDDNKPAKEIKRFARETNLPLRVGLLVDASNSIRDRFKFEQEAAIEFLNQIIRPKSDRAFVIGFDTTAEVTADFTDSTEKLSHGVRMLRPGGGTALYDAVFFACRDKLMKAPQPGPVRRAIILVSDGEDNQSRVTREEAIEMAQRAEVIVYAISTNVSGVKLRGDKVLERMADATGGRAFFPFKVQDVANAFSEIQDELRSQYEVAYKPADFTTDGKYHSIEILAENHKNLRVRARRGYYAPRQ